MTTKNKTVHCPAADLGSLSPKDVAQLIVALVRLRHTDASGRLADLLTRMEARSALFSKADHSQLRAAWKQLGAVQKRARLKGRGGREAGRGGS